ncbi:MAG: hypothetical protein LBS06_06935 [Treponema sp.]|jgi:hypothetical protein|nr:hypothetical protein [Treponema sp.]
MKKSIHGLMCGKRTITVAGSMQSYPDVAESSIKSEPWLVINEAAAKAEGGPRYIMILLVIPSSRRETTCHENFNFPAGKVYSVTEKEITVLEDTK